MPQEFGKLIKRQVQLNALTYFLILALVTSTGLLVYLITSSGMMPGFWVLSSQWVRYFSFAFLLAVVVYLALQHQQMRYALTESTTALEKAEREYEEACGRLTFAHTASEIMTGTRSSEALQSLLAEILVHFDVDAAAIVGEEVEIVTAPGVEENTAHRSVLAAAIDTVRAGRPMALTEVEGGSTTLAVPLRIHGQLRDVLCIWRAGGSLPAEQLEGLQLVARVVELGLENTGLFDELHAKLNGMLDALLELAEHRYPGYRSHAEDVAELSVAVGQRLALNEEECAELRMAALLHDVGMLELKDGARVPGDDGPLGCVEHPTLGAHLACSARMGTEVQSAIRSHHEHVDGSGYPQGLMGDSIPLSARILAVCEAYKGMSTGSENREWKPEEAMDLIRLGSGRLYDPRVVKALQRVAPATEDRRRALGELVALGDSVRSA
jgi:HD-GYP domain-containing protein (c-di-GMP phosphodiesterase class II)